ncbi:unnamed protein product [Rhizoctonia solani]|uniref:G2/mitotic-specific cyclin cdc13 n=1 Tax=Rhizoctonia solani TaxID=456999 RepID=A0A8H2XYV7_9AGAM|nr:unnamed protein product [Rhizoctonia solani]
MSAPMDLDLQPDHFHPNSPESNSQLPFDAALFNASIIAAIEKHRSKKPADFMSSELLFYDDPIILLRILLKTILAECCMSDKDCKMHLAKYSSLAQELDRAYVSQEFAHLRHNPNMPLEQARSKVSGLTPSGSNPDLKSAFEVPYKGDTDKLFVNTLNYVRDSYAGASAAQRPYNWSIAVIQSSGMGKSRMVDEASNRIFTIPINIREHLPDDKKAYPPPDKDMRTFFEESRVKNDKQQQEDYMILLQVLFTMAREAAQNLTPDLEGKKRATKWANFLKEGQTEVKIGPNREAFYREVFTRAKQAIDTNEQRSHTNDKGVVVEENKRALRANDKKHLEENKQLVCNLEGSLRDSCAKLMEFIQPSQSAGNACFVYFDEAHSLTEGVQDPSPNKKHKRSAYHNLGTVLSKLTDYRIFFIFLSTNSRLEGFAPPPSHYPSDRVTLGSELIPPFTELPFDIYENEVLQGVVDDVGALTLESVCATKAMVGFGRTLWYAQREIKPEKNIFEFVLDKLTASGLSIDDSLLAALGVRVGITFDKTNNASYCTESRLVESHLRVVYSIPRHRGFMDTGSPSEPVVAEAASRYLNGPGLDITQVGPQRLSVELEKGLLARGERGELAGRLLVTVAHDIALKSRPKSNEHEPQFHRPIPVLDFLRALFHLSHHKRILEAKPVAPPGGSVPVPLQTAFSKSFVCFSHFALAGDSEMLSASALATALVRGMALQAKDGQESIDAVIPVHMGSLDVPISPKTTSAINLQFKNRKTAGECHVIRSISVPNPEMPVISIVFEFGVTKPDGHAQVEAERMIRWVM